MGENESQRACITATGLFLVPGTSEGCETKGMDSEWVALIIKDYFVSHNTSEFEFPGT